MSTDELKQQAEELMGQDDFEAAADLLEANRSLVDPDLSLSWDLGWCYYRLDRYAQAEPHLKRAEPMGPAGKGTLGSLYLKMDRDAEAETMFLDAIKGKDSVLARWGLALALMKQGKLEEAERVHRENIDIDPTDAERVEAYADFLSDVGREEEAEQMYERAKRLTGKDQ